MGAPPLILLPGALGAFEGSDAAAQLLRRHRPVIEIAYHEEEGLEALLARIEAAADEAGAGPVDLLGQSYGGWIAQCFARLRPERVRRLVLSHSFCLAPGGAWRFRLARALLRSLPETLITKLLRKRIKLALRPIAQTRPDLHRRQLAAIEPLLASRSFRAGLSAQQQCMWQSLQPAATKLPPVEAPVMIVESKNDPLIGKRARAALRACHPRALLLRFPNAGHVSAIIETETYVVAVEAFLDDDGLDDDGLEDEGAAPT